MAEKKFKVVGIGEILWDILPQGKVLGGAPANFAYHASALGAAGFAISAVGNDALGHEVIETLASYPVGIWLSRTDYPTGVVQVTISGKGIPEYEIMEEVAWDYIPLHPEELELARTTHAVCFGSLAQRNEVSRQTILTFVKQVPDQALKVFDINLRQHYYNRELITQSLEIANILKINDEELEVVRDLFGWEGTDEQICRKILDTYQLKGLALTCGTEGSYLFREEETTFLPTPVVEVKDTVGAGDAFTAALVMGWLQGKSLLECHQLAVNVSAFVCTQTGAMPEYSISLKNKLTAGMQLVE